MAASLVSRYDVAVIGSGFAGLSAGARLAGRGARVLVLEARSRMGGRATAFADRESGQRVDNGQHVLLGCYSDTLAFLRDIDALDGVRVQPQLRVSMVDRAGCWSRLECPTLPAPLNLLAGAFEWPALGWRDRLAILHMAAPKAPSPEESVDAWLIRNQQTERLREMLWEPLALAALNQQPSQAAAPVFARVLREMFRTPQSSALVLPSRPLDEMYARPAREYIERHGGSVRLGSPATIRLEGEHVDSVAAGSDRWAVSAAISAVPWFAIGRVLTGDTRGIEPLLTEAARMASSPIVTVNLWFNRPIIDEPFLGLPGRAMQWVFDTGAAFGEGAAHLSLVSSGASAILERDNATLVQMARQELLDAIPAAHEAELTGSSVVREPRATFSLAPGQPRRPSTVTLIRGLFLAGDWIETGLPATIESAVRSGRWAADAALKP